MAHIATIRVDDCEARLFSTDGGGLFWLGDPPLESAVEALELEADGGLSGYVGAVASRVGGRVVWVASPALLPAIDLGGVGSGNFGHAGRPGIRGGSAPKGGGGVPAKGGPDKGKKEVDVGAILKKNRSFARQVDPEEFVRVRDANVPADKVAFVTPYSADAYREMGARVFLSQSGKSGFAVKPDGDITSVFSASGSGEGKSAIMAAVAHGGSKLDCFGGFLSDTFYPSLGFKEYDRYTWDDQYAPDGWDYQKYDNPDVVFMRL